MISPLYNAVTSFSRSQIKPLLALLAALAFMLLPALAMAEDADRPPVILALGTSLTAGYELTQEEGFTAVLSHALDEAGYRAEIRNAGVSGDTSAGGLARLPWLLDDDITHAIVELGSNDALRGQPPSETEANLNEILTLLKARDIKVLLTGMLAPPNLGPEYGAAFAALYPRLAETHDVALYPFFLDGVAAEPSLNLPDGIHPNAAGTKIIVERLLPHVISLLGGPADETDETAAGD